MICYGIRANWVEPVHNSETVCAVFHVDETFIFGHNIEKMSHYHTQEFEFTPEIYLTIHTTIRNKARWFK
jgi:hypothetical protein